MKMNMKDEEKLFKDIENGKYREFYLVYNRKSTDEPDNQKNSISYQKNQNVRFAKLEGLPLAPLTLKSFCADGIISEKHSGFKEDSEITITNEGLVQYKIERPKFQKLLMYLSRGLFKGIVCLCWDRVSRNKGDDTVVRKLMKNGIDVRFVFAKYDKTSSGELHMDIDGMFSQHHSRVTSEKVSLTIKHAREKGKCTNRAPIGYLNEGNMDYKPLDPERAPIIRRLYELYSTGDWSLSDLARYANEQGLTTVAMRRKRTEEEKLAEEEDDNLIDIPKVSRPITQNHVHRMLTSPFYIGMVPAGNGKHTRSSSHQPLVPVNLFNDVQQLLRKNKTSIHYTEKLDLPLRGLVRCALCQRIYTPYVKKGITYYSSRCVAGCENKTKNFNFDYIADKIGEKIAKLHYTEDELAEMDARSSTQISLLEEKRSTKIEEMERKKKVLREQLKYIRVDRLPLLHSGAYTPEGIVAEEKRLEGEIAALMTDEQVSEEAMSETVKDITQLSELLKRSVPYYDFAKPHKKELIARCIFSELLLSGDTLQHKVKKGFEAFENRFVANCDPTGSRTPITALRRPCPNH